MSVRPQNAFLRALDPQAYAWLENRLEPVQLDLGTYVHREEERIDWVYFPEGCMLSMITTDDLGYGVETSMAGTEGAGGLLEACGSQVASVDCVIQVDGPARRVLATSCRELIALMPGFTQNVLQLAELQIIECRTSGFCQGAHNAEQRFARWLGESYSRSLKRNPLPLTQEFMAAMLGVQRTTVTSVAGKLQRKGIIHYSRGNIEITDFARLESLACGCRAHLIGERHRLSLAAI